MTNKTTSAIAESKVAYCIRMAHEAPGALGNTELEFMADTIIRLQAALESAVATLRRTHDDIMLGCEREDTLTNINAEIRNLRSSVGGE